MTNFGKISKVFAKLDGMFEKCFMEPALHGWSLFDVNGDFIGMITENGFAQNLEYPHANKISVKLNNRGVTSFDYETFQLVELQEIIDESLIESD